MSKHPISILSSLLIITSLLTGCSPQHSEPNPKSPPIQLQPTPGTPYQTPESSTAAESPAASSDGFSLTSVPAYSGEAFVEINGNKPYFSDSDLTNVIYLDLSPLDDLGRAGVANAVLGPESLQTEERGDISSIHPSGWWEAKESDINVNRCHLIGNQLYGNETDVSENMVTGSRYLNVVGMLPYENEIADYLKSSLNHVRYRVTPVFDGNDVTAHGVLMEAESVEDSGKTLEFCVYCYNVDPDYEIDYLTGEWSKKYEPEYTETEAPESESAAGMGREETKTYVLNVSSKKIHRPDCSSVSKISEKNKEEVQDSYSHLLKEGYTPCGICNPD